MQNIKFKPEAILKSGKTVKLKCKSEKKHIGGIDLYKVVLVNTTDRKISIKRVKLFEEGVAVSNLKVFRQGFYMPSEPKGFYDLKAGIKVPEIKNWHPPYLSAWEFMSHTMCVYAGKGKKKTLLGFTEFNNYESYFVFKTRGREIKISAWSNLDNITLAPDQELEMESIAVYSDTDFSKCLSKYTDYVAETCNAVLPEETVTGWIDWQYYREEKCEKDILENSKALSRLKKQGFPLDYIIVDGGWCRYASEWLEPCKKFPSGMKKLSARVRKEGFKLGIWFAPYITNVKTRVVKEHPEWLVINEKTGKPLYKENSNVGPCHIIDFSIPEALDWLRDIVRTMVRDWKVGYLKLDGPNMSHYWGGVFNLPDSTAVQQVRKSLEVIYEECKGKVIIEGEGIYGPSIGCVHTQRTTQDNHTYWYDSDTGRPVVKENLRNDLLSAFTHNKFWHNHRENIILRDFPS
ncbi:MAG: alpha-galactosidase, partial [Planctomycetota bacterium]